MAATTLSIDNWRITLPPFTTFSNLGPLPLTSFPSDCVSSLWDMKTTGLGVPWTFATAGCAVRTCCPSGLFYSQPFAWYTSYYSPGVCPEQYYTCKVPFDFLTASLAPDENVYLCVLTNYGCPYQSAGNIWQFPASALSTSTTIIVMDNIYSQRTVSTRPFVLGAGFQAEWQIAYPIQIRSRKGETIPTSKRPSATATTTSSYANSILSAAPSGTQSSLPISTSSAQPSPEQGSPRLATGAIIGIAFGSVTTLIIIIGLLLFYLNERRKVRALGIALWMNNLDMAQERERGYNLKAELEGNSSRQAPPVHELANSSGHAAYRVAELQGNDIAPRMGR